MTVLALDCSSRSASCALVRDGVLAGECYLDCGLTHSQTLLPMAESLLTLAGLRPGSVERVAVSAGPGSFTGLRIGLSSAKALAAALQAPCAGVSTLLALAYGLRAYEGICCAALDARRDEVYAALFELRGGRVRRLCEDRALPAAQLLREDALTGAPVLLCGDGAPVCLRAWAGRPDVLEHTRLAPPEALHQRASGVAFAALDGGEWVPAGALRPVYLRLSQAERERLEKQKKQNHLES